jgi:hypothetical protein
MNGTLTLQAIIGKFVVGQGIAPNTPSRIIEGTQDDD